MCEWEATGIRYPGVTGHRSRPTDAHLRAWYVCVCVRNRINCSTGAVSQIHAGAAANSRSRPTGLLREFAAAVTTNIPYTVNHAPYITTYTSRMIHRCPGTGTVGSQPSAQLDALHSPDVSVPPGALSAATV